MRRAVVPCAMVPCAFAVVPSARFQFKLTFSPIEVPHTRGKFLCPFRSEVQDLETIPLFLNCRWPVVTIRIGILHGKRFDYIVISRRSCFRAGTRYYMRGLDSQGHVANYVETEQIVQCNGWRGSFVQVRLKLFKFFQNYQCTRRPQCILVSKRRGAVVSSNHDLQSWLEECTQKKDEVLVGDVRFVHINADIATRVTGCNRNYWKRDICIIQTSGPKPTVLIQIDLPSPSESASQIVDVAPSTRD